MIQIFDKNYSDLKPIQPKYNALCIFSINAAKIAFSYGLCDFVFCMNEKTNAFKKCINLKQCIDFFEN